MALEKPEVSSENRGPGFVAIRRKIIFTQDELQLCVFVCVCACLAFLCEGSVCCVCQDV